MRHLHRLTCSIALVSSLFGCAGELDEAGSAAATDEATTSTLTFSRDHTQRASGALTVGRRVRIVYDAARLTSCRGEQGGIAQWSIGGFARIGDGPVQSFTVAGLNAGSAAPTIALDRAGELQVWFQNTNRWGCNAWDSNYGDNYRFTVGLPSNAPGWVGDGAWVIARETCGGGPCASSRRPLSTTFDYDTWARQRAAFRAVYFDVWKSGVTDRDNPDLWRQLDVRVLYRPVGTTQWTIRHVPFNARVGNNARYALPLRDIDPLGENTVTRREDCPRAALSRSADGSYVSAEVEYYVWVNGMEYRPSPGGAFRGRFTNHRGLYDLCLSR